MPPGTAVRDEEPPVEQGAILVLLEVSRALAGEADLRAALGAVLGRLDRRLGVERSTIAVVDEGERVRVETEGMVAGGVAGALVVDLPAEPESDGDATLELMRGVAALIGQAVQVARGSGPAAAAASERDGAPASLADLVGTFEQGLIEEALRAARGSRAHAARLLRTTERILSYRIRRYGIDPARFR